MVYIALDRLLRDIDVHVFASGIYIAGELHEIYSTGTYRAAVIPISPGELRFKAESGYNYESRKFYSKASGITAKSVIDFQNKKYFVDDIMDRSFEGGYYIYYGKRITDDTI